MLTASNSVWPKKMKTKNTNVHNSLKVMGSNPGYLLKSSLLYMNQINALTLQRSKAELNQDQKWLFDPCPKHIWTNWRSKLINFIIFHPNIFMEIFYSFLIFFCENVIHTLAESFMKRRLKRTKKIHKYISKQN